MIRGPVRDGWGVFIWGSFRYIPLGANSRNHTNHTNKPPDIQGYALTCPDGWTGGDPDGWGQCVGLSGHPGATLSDLKACSDNDEDPDIYAICDIGEG